MVSLTKLTLENSSPMMVFSLEKSMMLKANLSPELGLEMIEMSINERLFLIDYIC